MRIKFGAGKWDSWGFGLNFCPYTRGITIEFIHWYAYVEFWTTKETEQYREVLTRIQEWERESSV